MRIRFRCVWPFAAAVAMACGSGIVDPSNQPVSFSRKPLLTMTPAADTIAVGETVQLTSTISQPKWTSRAPSVASVNSTGLVTGVSLGQTYIVASKGQQKDSSRITVAGSPPPPPPSCSLVTDWNPRPTTPMAKPGYLSPVTEPDFGTKLVRIAGDPGTAVGSGLGTWGNLSVHAYSKEPAWNADGSLLVLRVTDSGGWLYLDGNTYQPLFRRGGTGAADLWDPVNPDYMVFTNPDGSVGRVNIRTGAITWLLQTNGAYNNATFGGGEGNISADGRWVAVQATRSSDAKKIAYAVDLTSGAKGGDLDLAAFNTVADWVSISAGGGYLVAHGVIDGVDQRIKAWSRSTLAQTGYWPTHPLGHNDLGFNVAGGNEVVFGGDAGTINPTQMVTLDLANGAVSAVSGPTTWDWHASTRNTLRQGWGYVTQNADPSGSGFALNGEIWAVKLDGSSSVERYAHHRMAGDGSYDKAAMASPSRDGKRIIFRSNWGSVNGPNQAYVVSCP